MLLIVITGLPLKFEKIKVKKLQNLLKKLQSFDFLGNLYKNFLLF